jgi:hypothetical protein
MRNVARGAAEAAAYDYSGSSSNELIARVKQAVEAQLRNVTSAAIFVEVIEEDEDMKLVRYIHEEPLDFIQVQVTATLDKPLKYLVIEFSPEPPHEKLGIEFVPAV